MTLGLEWRTAPAVEVARVGEHRQSLLFALFIHCLKAARGISISPRVSKSRGMPAFFNFSFGNRERDRADGAHVQGDVFADRAVAARDAAFEASVVVDEGQRHAVELQLAHVLESVWPLSSCTRRSQSRSSSSL